MISQSRAEQQDEQIYYLSTNTQDCANTQIDTRTEFARSPVAIHSCFRDGVSIINLSTGGYFRLEALGFRIWKILARPSTIEEIEAELVADRAIEPDVADTTIVAFLDSLRHAGLVVVA